MSGHSKWATTKYRKGAQDQARAKVFAKMIRQIEVAAREGGSDIEHQRHAAHRCTQKARDASVPMDTIERAIKRGSGELEGVRYEAVNYEGYAPGGVAVIVETLTDNRNRTGAEMRNLFSRNGGSMAEPGAVSWQFERKGVARTRPRPRRGPHHGGGHGCRCRGPGRRRRPLAAASAPPTTWPRCAAPGGGGIRVHSAELSLVPTSTVAVDDEGEAKKVLRLLEAHRRPR